MSDVYVSSRDKLLWECGCGYRWKTKYSHVQQGHWCPRCSGHAPIGIEDAQVIANKRQGKCLSNVLHKSTDVLTWQCKNKHVWKAVYKNVRHLGRWCPRCKGGVSLSLESAKKLAQLRDGCCLSKQCKNQKSVLKWRCKKGHEWSKSYKNIKKGSWCPRCSKWKSQRALYVILQEMFTQSIILTNYRGFNWLKNDRRLELDFFIKNKDFSLGIEYDGEQHFVPISIFGGEEGLEKVRKRDRLKNELLAKNKDEVNFFVRFNYKEPLTKEYVKNKIEVALSHGR